MKRRQLGVRRKFDMALSQGLRCAHCGKYLGYYNRWSHRKELNRHASVEHIVPLCKGGTYSYGNLVILCRDCNIGKNADIPENIGMYYVFLSKKKRREMLKYYRSWKNSVGNNMEFQDIEDS